jgi:hypothetical protein
MSLFPDIPPNFEYIETPVFITETLGITDGNLTQRRSKRTLPLMQFSLKYDIREQAAEIKLIFDLFLSCRGMWAPFSFFSFDSYPYVGVAIGTGTGALTTFTLGAKSTSAWLIYVAGALQDSSYYDISAGTGVDAQDQVIFKAGHIPGNGTAVTASYKGRRYYPLCIFGTDMLGRSAIMDGYYSTSFIVQEVTA